MNPLQQEAALQAMVNWLAHPSELGKVPNKILCAGEFRLHDMVYYIFKFRKSLFGKWMVGVCGGFEGDSPEHCGHVFSNLTEYREETAKEDCIAMVEMIRAYWMQQAELYKEQSQA